MVLDEERAELEWQWIGRFGADLFEMLWFEVAPSAFAQGQLMHRIQLGLRSR